MPGPGSGSLEIATVYAAIPAADVGIADELAAAGPSGPGSGSLERARILALLPAADAGVSVEASLVDTGAGPYVVYSWDFGRASDRASVSGNVSPDVLVDRHGRVVAAKSLYLDLTKRYGLFEGERIYYAMARERKGPFAEAGKYADRLPLEATVPRIPPPKGAFIRPVAAVKPPPRRA